MREAREGIRETKEELQEIREGLRETRAIANSNARTIQAMLDRSEEDRLKHEERMAQSEQSIQEIRALTAQMSKIQQGVVNLVGSLDEERPTIMKRLMSIENKVDRLISEKN